ncbi:hypothetical protein PLICRDRAFT_31597 [Plicaturopsis crispa FD-325 SS-3]|nr:hypothetical protein PLICRDRAFT_31597 [Plicaturopsis crispa FD-325 SS-3]
MFPLRSAPRYNGGLTGNSSSPGRSNSSDILEELWRISDSYFEGALSSKVLSLAELTFDHVPVQVQKSRFSHIVQLDLRFAAEAGKALSEMQHLLTRVGDLKGISVWVIDPELSGTSMNTLTLGTSSFDTARFRWDVLSKRLAIAHAWLSHHCSGSPLPFDQQPAKAAWSARRTLQSVSPPQATTHPQTAPMAGWPSKEDISAHVQVACREDEAREQAHAKALHDEDCCTGRGWGNRQRVAYRENKRDWNEESQGRVSCRTHAEIAETALPQIQPSAAQGQSRLPVADSRRSPSPQLPSTRQLQRISSHLAPSAVRQVIMPPPHTAASNAETATSLHQLALALAIEDTLNSPPVPPSHFPARTTSQSHPPQLYEAGTRTHGLESPQLSMEGRRRLCGDNTRKRGVSGDRAEEIGSGERANKSNKLPPREGIGVGDRCSQDRAVDRVSCACSSPSTEPGCRHTRATRLERGMVEPASSSSARGSFDVAGLGRPRSTSMSPWCAGSAVISDLHPTPVLLASDLHDAREGRAPSPATTPHAISTKPRLPAEKAAQRVRESRPQRATRQTTSIQWLSRPEIPSAQAPLTALDVVAQKPVSASLSDSLSRRSGDRCTAGDRQVKEESEEGSEDLRKLPSEVGRHTTGSVQGDLPPLPPLTNSSIISTLQTHPPEQPVNAARRMLSPVCRPTTLILGRSIESALIAPSRPLLSTPALPADSRRLNPSTLPPESIAKDAPPPHLANEGLAAIWMPARSAKCEVQRQALAWQHHNGSHLDSEVTYGEGEEELRRNFEGQQEWSEMRSVAGFVTDSPPPSHLSATVTSQSHSLARPDRTASSASIYPLPPPLPPSASRSHQQTSRSTAEDSPTELACVQMLAHTPPTRASLAFSTSPRSSLAGPESLELSVGVGWSCTGRDRSARDRSKGGNRGDECGVGDRVSATPSSQSLTPPPKDATLESSEERDMRVNRKTDTSGDSAHVVSCRVPVSCAEHLPQRTPSSRNTVQPPHIPHFRPPPDANCVADLFPGPDNPRIARPTPAPSPPTAALPVALNALTPATSPSSSPPNSTLPVASNTLTATPPAQALALSAPHVTVPLHYPSVVSTQPQPPASTTLDAQTTTRTRTPLSSLDDYQAPTLCANEEVRTQAQTPLEQDATHESSNNRCARADGKLDTSGNLQERVIRHAHVLRPERLPSQPQHSSGTAESLASQSADQRPQLATPWSPSTSMTLHREYVNVIPQSAALLAPAHTLSALVFRTDTTNSLFSPTLTAAATNAFTPTPSPPALIPALSSPSYSSPPGSALPAVSSSASAPTSASPPLASTLRLALSSLMNPPPSVITRTTPVANSAESCATRSDDSELGDIVIERTTVRRDVGKIASQLKVQVNEVGTGGHICATCRRVWTHGLAVQRRLPREGIGTRDEARREPAIVTSSAQKACLSPPDNERTESSSMPARAARSDRELARPISEFRARGMFDVAGLGQPHSLSSLSQYIALIGLAFTPLHPPLLTSSTAVRLPVHAVSTMPIIVAFVPSIPQLQHRPSNRAPFPCRPPKSAPTHLAPLGTASRGNEAMLCAMRSPRTMVVACESSPPYASRVQSLPCCGFPRPVIPPSYASLIALDDVVPEQALVSLSNYAVHRRVGPDNAQATPSLCVVPRPSDSSPSCMLVSPPSLASAGARLSCLLWPPPSITSASASRARSLSLLPSPVHLPAMNNVMCIARAKDRLKLASEGLTTLSHSDEDLVRANKYTLYQAGRPAAQIPRFHDPLNTIRSASLTLALAVLGSGRAKRHGRLRRGLTARRSIAVLLYAASTAYGRAGILVLYRAYYVTRGLTTFTRFDSNPAPYVFGPQTTGAEPTIIACSSESVLCPYPRKSNRFQHQASRPTENHGLTARSCAGRFAGNASVNTGIGHRAPPLQDSFQTGRVHPGGLHLTVLSPPIHPQTYTCNQGNVLLGVLLPAGSDSALVVHRQQEVGGRGDRYRRAAQMPSTRQCPARTRDLAYKVPECNGEMPEGLQMILYFPLSFLFNFFLSLSSS